MFMTAVAIIMCYLLCFTLSFLFRLIIPHFLQKILNLIKFSICLSATESSQIQDDLDHYKEIITKRENDLQTLRAEFDLLKSNLALRMELTSELEVQVQNLEKKVHAAEEEAHGATHKLNVALEEKKGFAHQVGGRNCRMLFTT